MFLSVLKMVWDRFFGTEDELVVRARKSPEAEAFLRDARRAEADGDWQSAELIRAYARSYFGV